MQSELFIQTNASNCNEEAKIWQVFVKLSNVAYAESSQNFDPFLNNKNNLDSSIAKNEESYSENFTLMMKTRTNHQIL